MAGTIGISTVALGELNGGSLRVKVVVVVVFEEVL